MIEAIDGVLLAVDVGGCVGGSGGCWVVAVAVVSVVVLVVLVMASVSAGGGSAGSSERRQMGQVACSCSHGEIHDEWNRCSHSNRDTVSPEM